MNTQQKSYYSAKELAGLPGLPTSERRVKTKAERENWLSQKKAGRGGGYEYHISSFPAETRNHLLHQLIAELPQQVSELAAVTAAETLPVVASKAQLPALAELKKHQRETMDARMFFIRLIERAVSAGYSIDKAITTIVTQAKEGTLPDEAARMIQYANARKGENRTLSYDGMKKWWSKWQKSGNNPAALAPKDTEKVTQNDLIDWVRDYDSKAKALILASNIPAWLPYFLDEYRQPQKPSVSLAVRRLKRRLPGGIETPSEHQVRRLMEKIPVIYLEKGRMTGAEYKSIKGYAERDSSEYEPMTICQIDGHSFKAYVAHPTTGAHFHPEVCGVICLTTKVMAGWSAGLAESWRTVSDAFRHACSVTEEKPWGGVMAILEGDRGAGNLAGVNSDEFFWIFSRIGTTFIAPEKGGNPQQRGGIERSNQSLWIRAAKDLPTYTGKDMDRGVRKRIYLKLEKDLKHMKDAGKVGQVEKTSELLMSWREFLEFIEQWVIEYNNTPHRALPKITAPPPGQPEGKQTRRHMTPFEAWAQAVADGWKPVLYEGDMLEHLMMPHERITVKREKFTLYGNTYHAYELCQYHGQEMIAAYDIHNAEQVWVLDLEERPVCVAKWNGNKRHAQPVSVVEKAIMDRENRRGGNLERKLDMIRREADRNTVEVATVRELPKDVIDFEQRQQEKERDKEKARGGKRFFADCHELAEDILQRQKNGDAVGEYEARWIADYQKSASGSRRVGLYLADPDCAGRFQQAASCN